jgi:hypothetical protein
MLIMRVRAVTEAGAPLRLATAILLGLVMALPWVLVVNAVIRSSGALLLIALAIWSIHYTMARFGSKRRGLFDKLTHTVFVAQ